MYVVLCTIYSLEYAFYLIWMQNQVCSPYIIYSMLKYWVQFSSVYISLRTTNLHVYKDRNEIWYSNTASIYAVVDSNHSQSNYIDIKKCPVEHLQFGNVLTTKKVQTGNTHIVILLLSWLNIDNSIMSWTELHARYFQGLWDPIIWTVS